MRREGEAGAALLDGLRIVDVSTYVAGPSAAMTLAQLGAEVIRVDPIGGATDTRRLPLDERGTSLYWSGLNKGKRSIEIDTACEAGRALVMRLLSLPGAGSGILLTNAVGQDWLSFENVCRHRADAVVVHILGKSDGTPAVDYTVNCEVGLPWVTGPEDNDRPVNHVLPAWDLLTGQQAALGVLAAERARRHTGRGQLVTIALADVAVATMGHLGFVADSVVNGRGRLREGNYLYGSFGCDFRTADGERVMIVALTQRHWQRLVELSGTAEVVAALERALDTDLSAEDARYEHREVIAALLRPWFADRSLADVSAALERSGVLWGRYRSVERFVHDPDSLLRASNVMVDVEHPGVGVYPTPRPALVTSGWHERTPRPAPVLGADTTDVLSELLELDGDDIADLRKHGIVGGVGR